MNSELSYAKKSQDYNVSNHNQKKKFTLKDLFEENSIIEREQDEEPNRYSSHYQEHDYIERVMQEFEEE